MKKFIALAFTLVLLALGSIIAITAEINSDKDTVTHTEKIIWGEPSIAEGATVKSVSHYNNYLIWDSVYTAGGNTNTNYKFHTTKHYSNSKPGLSGFLLQSDIRYGFDLQTPASEQTGIARIYKELYDSLDYEEQGSTTVRLADYYEFYPLSVNINIPTAFFNADVERISSGHNIISTVESDKVKIYNDICEFFKIPVLDSEYVDINVSKHRGNSVGFGHGWSDKSNDVYSMYTRSAYTDKACYISVNNRTENGSIMDFSNIPGGYGIYALPYEGAKLKSDELAMVYTLDEDTVVNYMAVSNDSTKLLLTLVENEASYFEVIDIATMTQIQKFKINDGSHYIVYPNDGFIAYEFENHVAVIEEKSGVYSLVFVADKFPTEQTDTKYFYFRSGAALDFDGERLIVVDNLYFTGDNYDRCGFFMAVYDKDGLQYFGEYESSLDANFKAATQYSFSCRPLGYFEVNWNK